MNVMEILTIFIPFAGAFLSLIVAMYIISTAGHGPAEWLLVAGIVSIAAWLLEYSFKIIAPGSVLMIQSHIVSLVAYPITIPSFYIGLQILLVGGFRIKRLHLITAVPFLTALIAVIINHFQPVPNLLIISDKISLWFSTILSLHLAIILLKNINNSSANTEKSSYIIFILIFISTASLTILDIVNRSFHNYYSNTILIIVMHFIIIRYYTAKKSRMKTVSAGQYLRLKTEHLNIQKIQLQIESLMKNDKVFCEENLSISGLAGMLNIRDYELSEILNLYYKTSFNQFVNSFRIDEAKILLKKAELSITQIALESGFNSQSTFYREFRRITGVTPSAFKDN